MVLAVAIAAVFLVSTVLIATEAEAKKKKIGIIEEIAVRAPIATSGDNAYITWWSNKTGNMKVMFRASTDNGVTFGDKMNLSNTTAADSDDSSFITGIELFMDGGMAQI